MHSLDIVIKEEYDRQKLLVIDYESALHDLPKGSISIKVIKGREYAYLKKRDAGKVITEYIGLSGSKEVNKLKKAIEQRKHIEQKLKQAKHLIKKMEKGIRASS